MPTTDSITPADVDALLDVTEGPCVSIFLPTSRVSRDADADRIVAKNLRNEAFDRLIGDHGLRRPEAQALVEPVDELLDDDGFWAHLGDGLAIFLAPTAQAVYRVGQPFEARLVVGRRFAVKPLIPLLTGDGTYRVLALSANAAAVYEGSRQGLTRLPVADMPTSLAEALDIDGGRPADRQPRRRTFGDEDDKVLYKKYFRRIDRSLRRLYAEASTPFVLAGVESLLPLFREVSTSRHLVDEGIHGNVEELSPAELHERAWPLVEAALDAPRRDALERYRSLQGTARVTDDLQTILSAAHEGRVQTLFLDVDVDRFGRFDVDSRELTVSGETPGDGDVELTGRAARWVLERGGEVLDASGDEIPGDEPAVALLRY